MKLTDCIKMAFSDLNKRKLRTALTSFGIAIGAMLVILMAGLGQGIQTISNDQVKQMDTFRLINVQPQSIANKGHVEAKKIDSDALNKFKKIKGVSTLLASIDATAIEISLSNKTANKVSIHGSNLNFSIFSDAEINQFKSDKKKVKKYGSSEAIIAGSNLKKDDVNSALVGNALLKHLGITNYKSVIGKTVDVTVSFPKIEGMPQKQPLVQHLTVVGVVNNAYSLGRYTIITSDENAAQIQEYYTNGTNYINDKGYDDVTVECKTMADVTTVNNAIKKLGYVANSEGYYADTMNNILVILKVLLTAAGVIVLLVASIGVINTMSMAVHEKTKSIGVMKSVGASKKNIRRMFIVQSGSLGFVGGALGTVIAVFGGIIINQVLIAHNIGNLQAGMKMIDIRPSIVIFTMLFTIIVAMIAGIVPARKAARLNPVDSLRFE